MKYILIATLIAASLSGCRTPPAATLTEKIDEFDILRLKIMERMAGTPNNQ